MMLSYNDIKDIKPQPVYRTKKAVYSDVIYTLDIETTSLYRVGDTWTIFDYTKPPKYYEDKDKAGVMYIAMIGIEDKVYYARTWDHVADALELISHKQIRKIFYVHNISFEFQFFRNMFEQRGYTVDNMLARKTRKPISFYVTELNIEFRCSYCLTNLSLEKSGERYGKRYTKAVGGLDYNKLRGYDTPLTDQELDYCERDITTLWDVIRHFRREYEHVANIPLTQTGEVRRELKKRTSKVYKDFCKSLIPDADVFMLLWRAFSGGLTHANYLHSGRIRHDVISKDLCSSYPTVLLFKYPVSKWRECTVEEIGRYKNDEFALLYIVKFKGIKCKYYNGYISYSKCNGISNPLVDNGRVLMCDACNMVLTDIDYDIIKSSYDIESEEIIKVYYARKSYLPQRFIEFILYLYAGKTELKNVEGQEHFYMKLKQMLNSLFGMCCTNLIKADADYQNGDWTPHSYIDTDYVQGKLDEQRESQSNIVAYQWGVWCTAYARRSLYLTLTGRDMDYNTQDPDMDIDTIYYDTDSIKHINGDKHIHIFEQYNKWVSEQLACACDYYKINKNQLAPKDRKGISHPLGVFETDGVYKDFITLGSKRYAYTDEKGLHCTVAGVSTRSGYLALDGRIENFTKDLLFNYDHAGKLTINYIDEQESVSFIDDFGNQHVYNDRFGICLQPTTYTLGIDEYYEHLTLWANAVNNISTLLKRG